MYIKLFAAAPAFALAAGAALAEHKHPSTEVHRHHQVAVAASQSASAQSASPSVVLTAGEVRKVDRGSAEIVLRHAAIRSMNMPAMTMPFGVKDSAMLDQVKVGDKIRFSAEVIDDRPIITRIVR